MKKLAPETIEIITASPSARAVASTAAATIAGRIARSVTASIARSGLRPSATAPSRQDLGAAASASQISAIMIGVIITVNDHRHDHQAFAGELDRVLHRGLLRAVIRWLPTNGTSTRIAIRP